MNTTKAAAIREVLRQHGPTISTKEVMRKLAEEQGLVVSPQQVSNQKAYIKRISESLSVDDLPISVIKKVKMLVDELGSSSIIRKALDDLEDLGE